MKAIQTLGRLLGVAAMVAGEARSTAHRFSSRQRKETAMKIIGVIATVLVGVGGAWAATINVPDDYETIQAGIDEARDGDTVLVAAGTYTGDGNRDISFRGKRIIVRTETGPQGCIINCEGNEHRGFRFSQQETRETVLDGFTITGGDIQAHAGVGGYGGGITIGHTDGEDASPTIRNCWIIGNSASFLGDGINVGETSFPLFENCLIANDTCAQVGGGIAVTGEADIEIVNCTIYGNSPEGVSTRYGSGDPAGQVIIVKNSIVFGNRDADLVDRQGGRGRFLITYNNLTGGWQGNGNISADPRFLDPDNGDFHLTRESPCIDAGDPEGDRDPDGTRADMGAFYVHQTFHRIALRRGWNILSSFNQPRTAEIPAVFADVVAREHLFLVKDQQGRFYMPERGFDNMPPWDVRQGYQAKLNNPDTLVIVNAPTEVGTPIPLRQGWNIVAYFPEGDITAPEAFANLGDNLIIAKDEQGRFYVRANRFSNMGRLTRGKGYQVKAAAEGELVYPAGQRLMAGGRTGIPACPHAMDSRTGIPACPDAMDRQECLSYYRPVEATGGNMSVLIADCKLQIANCGEIGVFTEGGLCVGATSVGQAFLPVTSEGQTGMSVLPVASEKQTGMSVLPVASEKQTGMSVLPGSEGQTGMSVLLGMAIWGDDPTTPEIDGATEGEPLTFKLWDGTGERAVVAEWIEGDGTYTTDGFAYAEIIRTATGMSPLPTEFALSAPFPNPFNSTVRIGFALPEASRARLALYDLSGRQVALLADAAYPAGYHSLVYAAYALPSGIYVVRGEFGRTTRLAKVTLLK